MTMNRKYSRIFMLLTALISSGLLLCTPLYAGARKAGARIYLKNGDRISGTVVLEDESRIKVDNTAAGILTIKRSDIKDIVYDKELRDYEPKKESPVLWSRDISVGYDKSGGNTKNSNLTVLLYANRKTDNNEFTLKGDIFYSSANDKMDAQKWYGLLRYAYSFGNRRWYNFYKFESDHDRFANIEYRLIPSTGAGYWFSDTPDWKALAELGIGLQHTKFRQDAKDKNEVVLLPRAFFEKTIFDKSRIVQDITLYPSLTDTGEYRLHSETALICPISKQFSIRFSFIDDYNSSPTDDAKKNDTRLISSLGYSF